MKDLANDEKFFSTRYVYNISLNMCANSNAKDRVFKTTFIYFHGFPGTGKSHLAIDNAKTLYPDQLPYCKTNGTWWDIYINEDSV